MTPTQLRAFHLVAEAGSFSAAGRASGLSQPNLSGQVTALEKSYGVRLFDRRGRIPSWGARIRKPAPCTSDATVIARLEAGHRTSLARSAKKGRQPP